MPFGAYKEHSVEQILLKDTSYFKYVLENVEIKKPSLKNRFELVEYAANNFVSHLGCAQCGNIPKIISIYDVPSGHSTSRTSGTNFIYCSKECFDEDPNIRDCANKVSLEKLAMYSAISPSKTDTKNLVRVISGCMGMKKKGITKQYLEDFFNETARDIKTSNNIRTDGLIQKTLF